MMSIMTQATHGRHPSAAPLAGAARVLGALALLALGGLASETALAQPGAVRGELDAELASLYDDTEVNPFDAIGANNLAVKLVARGDYEKARKLLQRAARLDPDRPEIARNADQVQQLIDQREQLSERSRNHFRDSFAAVDVPSVADVWVPNGPRSFGPRADRAARADRADGAASSAGDERVQVEATVEQIAANPFDTRWLLERAAIKTRRGEHRAALADLRRAQVLDPYLSGIESRIDRLRRLLPEDVESASAASPRSSGGARAAVRPFDDEAEVPAPWSLEGQSATEAAKP